MSIAMHGHGSLCNCGVSTYATRAWDVWHRDRDRNVPSRPSCGARWSLEYSAPETRCVPV